MLNRRLLRIKIYQGLYAMHSLQMRTIEQAKALIANQFFVPFDERTEEYNLDIDSVNSSSKIKFTTLPIVDEIQKSTNEIQLDEHIYNIIDDNGLKGTIIIASDMVLATLMNFSKSVYSWDIEVKKEGNFIFIDKREKQETEEFVSVELETIAENSTTPPPSNAEDKAKSNYRIKID